MLVDVALLALALRKGNLLRIAFDEFSDMLKEVGMGLQILMLNKRLEQILVSEDDEDEDEDVDSDPENALYRALADGANRYQIVTCTTFILALRAKTDDFTRLPAPRIGGSRGPNQDAPYAIVFAWHEEDWALMLVVMESSLGWIWSSDPQGDHREFSAQYEVPPHELFELLRSRMKGD